MYSIPTARLLRRNPIFRNFLLATTISLIGTCIFDISIPLYVLARTHSVWALAAANIALTLPYFLMAPMTGYTVDHFDKRKIMILSDLGQVVAMIFLLGYEMWQGQALWPILVAVFFAKTLMILFETVTTFQLVPAMVEPGDLSSANMYFLSSHRIIQVIGPLIGGFLLAGLGMRSCIIANIVSFGATLFFTYKLSHLNELIEGEPDDAKENVSLSLRHMATDFKESLRYVWNSPLFRPFVCLMFLWNLSSLIPNTPTLTYYFTEAFHFGPERYGAVLSFIGVLGVIGYFHAAQVYKNASFARTFSRSAVWQATFATGAILFMPMPLMLAALFGVSRMMTSVLTLGTFLLRQTEVPRTQIGAVNASIRMFFMSAAPISAVLQAFLIKHYGVSSSLVLGAVCMWGTAWYAQKVSYAFELKYPNFAEKKAAA